MHLQLSCEHLPTKLGSSQPSAIIQIELPMADLTPKEVVEMLDRYIVGQVCTACHSMLVCRKSGIHAELKVRHTLSPCSQADAKRAVANALRNRWRRHKIPSPLKVQTASHSGSFLNRLVAPGASAIAVTTCKCHVTGSCDRM